MRIHLIGIGGMGMGTLTGLLVARGDRVTGSDTELYPPMSDQLKELGVTVLDGYKAENLADRPDLVVVGNVIRRDNPEAQALLQSGIKYLSLPQALQELFLERKRAIVIAGTHGKSTTTVLTAWLLEAAGLSPSLFAGAISKNFNVSYRNGKGDHFVVEGDEYDTAFFDKRPKFCSWRPSVGVLTSAEFDHADIYAGWEAVRQAFLKFLETLGLESPLVACIDDPHVRDLIGRAHSPVLTYGLSGDAALYGWGLQMDEEGTRFQAKGPGLDPTRFVIPMWGEHNVRNALASIGVGLKCGIRPEVLQQGCKTFRGLKRRQELLGSKKGIRVIDDFAHHPTAVRETIRSIRGRYPGLPVWAIFEPRSNTSRRKVFQKEFVEALGLADRIVVSGVASPEKIPAQERLDVEQLVADLKERGHAAWHLPEPQSIEDWLPAQLRGDAVLLFMSNGNFGGLPQKMLLRL